MDPGAEHGDAEAEQADVSERLRNWRRETPI
jgi:hypothetical protein